VFWVLRRLRKPCVKPCVACVRLESGLKQSSKQRKLTTNAYILVAVVAAADDDDDGDDDVMEQEREEKSEEDRCNRLFTFPRRSHRQPIMKALSESSSRKLDTCFRTSDTQSALA